MSSPISGRVVVLDRIGLDSGTLAGVGRRAEAQDDGLVGLGHGVRHDRHGIGLQPAGMVTELAAL